jgi:hypothetical protein
MTLQTIDDLLKHELEIILFQFTVFTVRLF